MLLAAITVSTQSAPLNTAIKAGYVACVAISLYGGAWYADKMNQHFFFQSPEQFRSLKKLLSQEGPARTVVNGVAQQLSYSTENLAVKTHEGGEPIKAQRVASIDVLSIRKDLAANPDNMLKFNIARELVRFKNNELEKEYAAKIGLTLLSLGISMHPRIRGAVTGLWAGGDNLMSCARIALGYQLGSTVSARSALQATQKAFETVAQKEIATSLTDPEQTPEEPTGT